MPQFNKPDPYQELLSFRSVIGHTFTPGGKKSEFEAVLVNERKTHTTIGEPFMVVDAFITQHHGNPLVVTKVLDANVDIYDIFWHSFARFIALTIPQQ